MSYPLASRDELLQAIPPLRGRYTSYSDFGASRIEDIFSESELRQAEVREAHVFASAVALNSGDGSFEVQLLPTEAQFAPIRAVLPNDFDGDGNTDLLVAGNFFGVPPIRGRYDASYGLLLRGDGAGGLATVDLDASNLVILGEARDMELVRHADGGHLIVVARNNEGLQILRPVAMK